MDLKYAKNALAAGAPPRTPLGSSRRSPRPPSRLKRGHPSPYLIAFGTDPTSVLTMPPLRIPARSTPMLVIGSSRVEDTLGDLSTSSSDFFVGTSLLVCFLPGHANFLQILSYSVNPVSLVFQAFAIVFASQCMTCYGSHHLFARRARTISVSKSQFLQSTGSIHKLTTVMMMMMCCVMGIRLRFSRVNADLDICCVGIYFKTH